jgi:hypothetical protein
MNLQVKFNRGPCRDWPNKYRLAKVPLTAGSGADDVTPCLLASSLRRFEVFYCLHVEGQTVLAQRHGVSVPSARTTAKLRSEKRQEV